MKQNELKLLIQFFKVLADENRLKIIGLLSAGERSVEELASILKIKEPTVSHHLNKFKELNLVKMNAEGNTHNYQFNTNVLIDMSREIFKPEKFSILADGIDEKNWDKRVLKNFLYKDRLLGIPVSRKKRLVVLKWLVNKFKRNAKYSEREINETIKKHHPDYATLRREFIINKLMNREKGIYWRI